jgi:hypothetical protein
VSSQEAKKAAIRRYIVFRVKAIEFLDLANLFQGLKDKHIGPWGPPWPLDYIANSLRTVLVSWSSLLVDKNGTNAIKLWIELFPQHANRVEETWTKMDPAWPILRQFRDSAGFHGDKPLRFFAARYELRAEIKQVLGAISEFEKLFKFLLKSEEKELPGLEKALDDFLDELEKAGGEFGENSSRRI